MDIKVFYSPQPDELNDTSAAYEYAKRTFDTLSNKGNVNNIVIQLLSVDNLNSLRDVEVNPEENNSPSITFIIVSCGADGSINRVIRKIMRNLKNHKTSNDEEGGLPSNNGNIAIALLGHARCENSANQMKDTIFNQGRKFHKCIEASSSSTLDISARLECQVELEGPDEPGGFDEWVNSNV